jgi:protein-S-isoprenylcysteine O-methyltransferase Ste14
MPITRKQIIALIAVYTERYVLSLVYLYFATTHFNGFIGLLSGRFAAENTLFIDATHKLTLFLLAAFSCALLLLARRAAVPPQKLKLILVPLAASFFNFCYYAEAWFPASWQISLSPTVLQLPLLAAGLVCIIIGPAIAFWGMLHLGRSFGVYVTVRTVVMTGPYKWIRHPMYLGWIFMNIGLVLANFSGFYFLLFAINLPLIIYRAGLEQAQLSAHSAEYREYMKHTRFIFPRLRNPFSRLRKAK